MTPTRRQPTIARLLGPAEPEILCDECFEKLDVYVDAELGHADAGRHGARHARPPRGLPGLLGGVREPARPRPAGRRPSELN